MRRLLILNSILLALAVAASVRFYGDWFMFEATHQPAAIQPQPEALPKIASTLSAKAAAPPDWTEIPSRNPFSFDRTDISILQPAALPVPPKPPGPKPILFGTISLGSDRLAMVAQGQPPGNRNYRSMKAGEVIDGWTISEIQDKSIVIKANSIQDSVIMNDPSAQVPRDYTRTLATSAAPAAAPAAQTGPFSQPPVSPPVSPPTAGQAPQRRRVIQMTPFGPREIEEPIQ